MFSFVTPEPAFDGYTLIIPSVSVGNVPQLTIDLLIATHSLKKAATVWHPAVVPSVGADPFDPDNEEVCTACELYASDELKLAVLQLRSTLTPHYLEEFLDKLMKNVDELKFARVIVLSSLFAHEMHNVKGEKFRYKSNGVKVNFPVIGDEVLSGSGYADKLYQTMSSIKKLELVLLYKYTSEGDNRPDAIQMLEALNVLGIGSDIRHVKFPFSWEHVFGNPPPIGIY